MKLIINTETFTKLNGGDYTRTILFDTKTNKFDLIYDRLFYSSYGIVPDPDYNFTLFDAIYTELYHSNRNLYVLLNLKMNSLLSEEMFFKLSMCLPFDQG